MNRIILTLNADDTVKMQAEGRFFFLIAGDDPKNPADGAEIVSTVTVPSLEHAAKMIAKDDVWPRCEMMDN